LKFVELSLDFKKKLFWVKMVKQNEKTSYLLTRWPDLEGQKMKCWKFNS
jgi:hypothetical protein